jgi:Domain of unknown function (DUF1839)
VALRQAVSSILAIPGLDAANYRRHGLHLEDRSWVEKNCYVDVWIEVIHALGLEPLAIAPFVAAIDFEGDQWTFFKPPHNELRDLYNIDVQELNVWRPLIEHAVEHLQSGKLISTEADAFWLPDTSGTDYRRQHTKSTIVLADLDVHERRLGYFHNAGYFTLDGEDFARAFHLDEAPNPGFMPLFAETARVDRIQKRPIAELASMSVELWRRHLRRVPATNPVMRFRERFASELADMQTRGLPFYHAWAFATTRQLGSAFELAAENLKWLQMNGSNNLTDAITQFESISSACKTFILKGARAVNSKRPLDAAPMFDEMAMAWERGITLLRKHFES